MKCSVNVAMIMLFHAANVAGNNDKLQDRVRRSDYVWPGGVQGQTSTSLAFCGDPGTPRHGSTVYTSWYERAIVTHSCNPGHVLEGAKRRICQQNGEWTPSIPKCLCESCINTRDMQSIVRVTEAS